MNTPILPVVIVVSFALLFLIGSLLAVVTLVWRVLLEPPKNEDCESNIED